MCATRDTINKGAAIIQSIVFIVLRRCISLKVRLRWTSFFCFYFHFFLDRKMKKDFIAGVAIRRGKTTKEGVVCGNDIATIHLQKL